jgi:23S rRNA (uracil1939-C5)-methyltransferase
VRKKKEPLVIEALEIENFAAEGQSIGRHDGKIVFAERTVPGDLVKLHVYKNKKDWAAGYPISYLRYSPHRIEPVCQHFGVCGGCQWQQVSYEVQAAFKEKEVSENLQRISRLPLPAVMPILQADKTYGYRNKVEYTFATRKFLPDDEFRRVVASGGDPRQPVSCSGYHAKGVFDKIVAIEFCHLQAEPTNAIRNGLTAFAISQKIPFYDLFHHTGWLRNMMVRIATTGQIMLNVIVAFNQADWQHQICDYLLTNFPEITTLLITINNKKNDSIAGLTPILVKGEGYITEKLGEFFFRIGPQSFFQTNSLQAKKLYDVTRDFAMLSGAETLYDLYCGTGSIGIYCSRGIKKIIGVELIDAAVKDARVNADINSVKNAFFYTGDVIEVCKDDFFEKEGRPDVIITDPPRAGMHGALIEKLLEIAAPVVVYVSCNPATQARDLALLHEKYSVERIQPVDMFPQTHHIENVIQLILRKE